MAECGPCGQQVAGQDMAQPRIKFPGDAGAPGVPSGIIQADDRPLRIRLSSTGAIVEVADPLRFIAEYEARLRTAQREPGGELTTAASVEVCKASLVEAGVQFGDPNTTAIMAIARAVLKWAADLGKDCAPGLS